MFKRYFPLLSIGAAAAALMIFPHISAAAAQSGLRVCAESIIPSLFPYLILTNLWCTLGYSEHLSRKAEKLMTKLFHLPGSAASAILIGFIGGFPAGAKTAAELYKSGSIRKKDAEQLLLFCSNAGPAFIFGIMGHGLFGSPAVGAMLWIIHFAGALFIGFLFRPAACNDRSSVHGSPRHEENIASAMVTAIQSAGSDVLRICMFVVFFSIAAGFLQSLIPDKRKGSLLYCFLLGLLELAGAGDLLKAASPDIAFVAASTLLAWNGLCVHCQVLSITAECGLSLKKYFFGKLMHMAISLTLACLLVPSIPFRHATGSTFPFHTFNGVLASILLLCIAVTKTSYGKRKRFRI